MSQQVYYAVVQGKTWGRYPKMFPSTLHKTNHGARMELLRRDDGDREKRKLYIKRFILKTKDAIHYDIMEHSYKVIRK